MNTENAKEKSSIISTGNTYRLYDSSVLTHTELPVGTYKVEFSEMSGHSLQKIADLKSNDEKVYGKHHARVERTLKTYRDMDRSLGVLLSGDKGMGKSLMIKMLAEEAMSTLHIPVIIVDKDIPGIAGFIEQIGEALIVFDEFEKVFAYSRRSDLEEENKQNQFLSLFDGVSGTKRAYVISVNNVDNLSPYILNRPGRFHYHLRFDYPSPDEITTYFADQAPEVSQDEVHEIIVFSQKAFINYDHLRALAFELNRGEKFSEIISELNIKKSRFSPDYNITLTLQDGTQISDVVQIDLNSSQNEQSIHMDLGGHDYLVCSIMLNMLSYQGNSIIVPPDAIKVHKGSISRTHIAYDPKAEWERELLKEFADSSKKTKNEEIVVIACTLEVKRNDSMSFNAF